MFQAISDISSMPSFLVKHFFYNITELTSSYFIPDKIEIDALNIKTFFKHMNI